MGRSVEVAIKALGAFHRKRRSMAVRRPCQNATPRFAMARLDGASRFWLSQLILSWPTVHASACFTSAAFPIALGSAPALCSLSRKLKPPLCRSLRAAFLREKCECPPPGFSGHPPVSGTPDISRIIGSTRIGSAALCEMPFGSSASVTGRFGGFQSRRV